MSASRLRPSTFRCSLYALFPLGVGGEFTTEEVEVVASVGPGWVVTVAAVVFFASLAILHAAAIRRLHSHRPNRRSEIATDTLTSVLIAVLLVSGALAVGFADELSTEPSTDTNDYSELFLLTESQNGTLQAMNYPTEYRHGDARSIQVGVSNHEGESVNYTVIVLLQRVTDRGGVVRDEDRIGRLEIQVPPGSSAIRQFSVRPTMNGSDLRLVFLLYRDSPPASPSMDNAYRSTYLWVNVSQ